MLSGGSERRTKHHMKLRLWKKNLLLFIIVVISVLAAGCGVKKVSVETVISGDVASSGKESYVLAEGESMQMKNTMLGGRFVHKNKVLYGSRHDTDGMPYLCRMKFTEGKNGMYVRETENIDTLTDASYLNLYDGKLFYIRKACITGETAIVSVDAEYGGSNEKTVIYQGKCDFLTISGGRLYFTDASDHLISALPDGTDMRVIIADKAVYYPYPIGKNVILYQDDADGESIHAYTISTGTDERVLDGPVYGFVADETGLHAYEGSSGREKVAQYYAENFEIDYDYDESGRITHMYFYEPKENRAGYIEIYQYEESGTAFADMTNKYK